VARAQQSQITCISADGKALATAANEGLSRHAECSVRASACSRTTHTADAGPRVRIYEFPSLKLLTTLDTGLEKGVRHMCLGELIDADSGDGLRTVCVNGRNGSCTVWEVGEGEGEGTKKPVKRASLNIPGAGTSKAEFRGCCFLPGTESLITGTPLTPAPARAGRR
jgi:hypothetical protein